MVDLINERFGTDFTPADQLFFDQIVEAAMKDDGLKQAAKVNPEDKFALVFSNLLETLFIERMDQNEGIFARYMNDPAFQALVAEWLAADVYRRLGGTPPTSGRVLTKPHLACLFCQHYLFRPAGATSNTRLECACKDGLKP